MAELSSEFDIFSDLYVASSCSVCSICVYCGGCTCAFDCSNCTWRARCICQDEKSTGDCQHSPFYVITVHVDDCGICGERCPVPCARSMPCTPANRHLCWFCNPMQAQRIVTPDIRIMSMAPPDLSNNESYFNPLVTLSDPLVRNDGSINLMSQEQFKACRDDLNARRVHFHLQHARYREMKQSLVMLRGENQGWMYISEAEELTFVDFIQVLLTQPRFLLPTVTVTGPEPIDPESHPSNHELDQLVKEILGEKPEKNDQAAPVRDPQPSPSGRAVLVSENLRFIDDDDDDHLGSAELSLGPIRRTTSIRNCRHVEFPCTNPHLTRFPADDVRHNRTVRFAEVNEIIPSTDGMKPFALLASMNGVANVEEMIQIGLMGSEDCFGSDFAPIGGHLHPNAIPCACDVCTRVAVWMDDAHRSMHSQ